MGAFPEEIQSILVHSGQHYDNHMSQAFFDDLGISSPDVNLGLGSGYHVEQTAILWWHLKKILRDASG